MSRRFLFWIFKNLSLLQKIFGKKQSEKNKEEWIAVYFSLSEDEFGSYAERDSIHQFTDKLDKVIRESGKGLFDGDEFGNGEGGLFMYGPNADQLFSVIQPLLRAWEPLKGGCVIIRYGAPESKRIQF